MEKKFVCPFCKRIYISPEGKGALYEHMRKEHEEELNNLSPAQVYFNWKNKYKLTKGNGISVISGKPTNFNEITERYERFLPEEKEAYRKLFLDRMKKVYGKETLLGDIEQQKKMLANRSISGRYK